MTEREMFKSKDACYTAEVIKISKNIHRKYKKIYTKSSNLYYGNQENNLNLYLQILLVNNGI